MVDGTRNQRYGEVLLVFPADKGLRVEVYNSYGLGTLPEELWTNLNSETIAKESDALAAVLNGPRYWMMDGIVKVDAIAPVLADFGGIPMRRAATIELDSMPTPQSFRPVPVNRAAAFAFDAGKEIYEVVNAEGQRWVLQAYCTGVDPALTYDQLAGLGSRITLPTGWTFEVRTLESELVVDTTEHAAFVLQDELQNSYCLQG
jgi:hypothetical protein